MSNPFYGPTGAPITQSRGASISIRTEFGLIETGFGLVNTALGLKGATTGQVWTGAHDFTAGTIRVPTRTQSDNSTYAASTAYVDAGLTVTLASARSYADGLVVGLWDDRGNFSAAANLFPSTGGSGSAGAVLKGDIWTISVAGTLGGVPVAARQTVRATIDTPGQTLGNWAIGLANTDLDDSITNGVTGRAPSQNAVFGALALKSDVGHTQALSTLTQSGATTGQIVSWSGTAWVPVAPSLLDITESLNTASPNATVPVVQLLVANAATNVDFALTPKGSGALTRSVADGTATGGNKRGIYAVDWQRGGVSATAVASGQSSVIGGGNGTNTASGDVSTIGGGSGNTASGGGSTIAGGYNNTASGTYSTILGGYNGNTRSITGALAWAGGFTTVSGGAQTEQFLMYVDTTSATAARATTSGTAASFANGPIQPNNSTYYCRVRILARNTTSGDSMSWTGVALINRGANAAATALIGSPTITSDFGSAGLAGCAVALSADTTLGCLAVTVTGLAATNIRWVAHIETLEATN